jgi:hypothetical protein
MRAEEREIGEVTGPELSSSSQGKRRGNRAVKAASDAVEKVARTLFENVVGHFKR